MRGGETRWPCGSWLGMTMSLCSAVVTGSPAADLGSTFLVSGISWLLTGLEQLQLEQLSSSPLGLSSSSRLGLGVIRLVHTQETGL